MLNDDSLPPVWERNSYDWLVDLAMRLKALEQEQSSNTDATIEVWHQVILLSQAELKLVQLTPSSKG